MTRALSSARALRRAKRRAGSEWERCGLVFRRRISRTDIVVMGKGGVMRVLAVGWCVEIGKIMVYVLCRDMKLMYMEANGVTLTLRWLFGYL